MFKVNLRPMVSGDTDFIVKSWSRCFTDQQPGNKPWLIKACSALIRELLKKSQVHILCLEEDEDMIIGYIVGEAPNTLHFIYLKFDYRRLGFGKQLMSLLFDFKDKIELTHWTHAAKHLQDKWNLTRGKLL